MKYITELQKKEIDKKYFPNGFLYTVKTFNTKSYSNSKRCDEPFETLQEYERTIKSIRHSNALRFFSHLKNMNEADFIKEINNQFLDYTLENRQHSEFWLSLTYDLVLKGFSVAGKIEDINLRGAFIDWHKLKVSELTKQPQQQEIKEPKGVIHKISVNNFKELYFVNLDRYLIESEKILEITDKIIYWKTKRYEYKKRYIELSSTNPFDELKLIMGTVGLGALENNPFEKFCDTQIKLLELETEYQPLMNKEPQQIETNKPDEVENIYLLNKNNFDNVEPQKVVNYFYKLVENGYITQSNFNLFINSVFSKNQKLNSKIDIIKPNSKGRVKKIFYNYYDSIQSEKYSNQEKYLKLLTDNFSGFNYNSLKTNFSK